MDALIRFRVATEDRALFELAASRARRSLSDWIRGVCLESAAEEVAADLTEDVLVATGASREQAKEAVAVARSKTAPKVDLKAASALAEGLAIDAPGGRLLPKDPKEVAKVVGATKNAPHRKVDPVERIVSKPLEDTRTRQEKADDFYRAKMAKGKKS